MRHNKKRNTALLYEFLIRHVSKCLIESRKAEANKAVGLLKKYYKAGPLCEELALFNNALHAKVQTNEYASKLLENVKWRAKKINSRRLNESKTKLIKEINRTFDADSFFAYKIPNYVMYATLQTLLNDHTGQKMISDSVHRLQLEEKIFTHLVSREKGKSDLKEALKLDPQYNNAVYRIVINKFNQKYEGMLNEAQKKLLSKYAVYLISENKRVLFKFLHEEVAKVKESLATVADKEISKDKDLLTKISECRQVLNSMPLDQISESLLVSVLRFMSLADEVSSNA